MITLITSSKTMTYKPAPKWIRATEPIFKQQAAQLVDHVLRQPDISKVLGVSQKIGDLNRARFEAWSSNMAADDLQSALWAYSGDVYNGVAVLDWEKEDLMYAQDHLRIISGLYGLVRPFDLVQPYRMEMITKLHGSWGKNLYDFWGSQLGGWLGRAKPMYVLDASSVAYSRAVTAYLPTETEVVLPEFLQETPNGLKQKALFSKYARGLLARWVMQHRIESPEQLELFKLEGITYSGRLSTKLKPVFIIPAEFTLMGRFTKT